MIDPTWTEIFELLNGPGWQEELRQQMSHNLTQLVVNKAVVSNGC